MSYEITFSFTALCPCCGKELPSSHYLTESRTTSHPLERDNPYERKDRRVFITPCWDCFEHREDDADAATVPVWRPIETAPKERGGLVDILNDGRRYAGCHYDRICDEYRHITACGVLIRLTKATHWMPEPADPDSQAPGAAHGATE